MGSVDVSSAAPRFLVVGAGSRGNAYARAVQVSTPGSIEAVVEIDPFKRQEFGRKYIWGQNQAQRHQSFVKLEEWMEWETERRKNVGSAGNQDAITGVFICTLDDTHEAIIRALAPFNLHILCEKPLALSLADCVSVSANLTKYPPKIVSIGHVLRYSPHNILLRKLVVQEQVIGEITSIEHTEPIGWWHFSHSYVRGNWRRATPEGVGSLLTKSCHDIDFLMWLLSSPSRLVGDRPHLPSTITSTGSLSHFRKRRKPAKAGNATNCLKCPAEPDCIYSAKKIYRDRWLRKEKYTGWPLKIVVPEIEDIIQEQGWDAGERELMDKLGEDYNKATDSDDTISSRAWYGRCVYEADNNVADEQTVTMAWEEDDIPGQSVGRGPKTAIFHMAYPTLAQCDRRGWIYGSLGEIHYDSKTISVHTFADGQTVTHTIPKQPEEVQRAHGGGDWGLAGAFVQAVAAVDSGAMSVDEAQRIFVGCDLEEIIRSHGVVFAAEDARMQKSVVRYQDWWAKKKTELLKK